MRSGLLWIACVLTIMLSAGRCVSQTLLPRKFPSTRVAVVIPGEQIAAPTDPDTVNEFVQMYGKATAEEVALWESTHFDYASGGQWGLPWNNNTIAGQYIYVQSIYTNLNGRDSGLRMIALRRGYEFESFALHFREDTYIDSNRVGFTDTVLYGKLPVVGYAGSNGQAKSSFNSSVDIFAYSNSGGGLWIAVPEKIDQLSFNLSQPGDPGTSGELVIEYPNQVDENFHITGWRRINVVEDTTNGLRQSGTIRWVPPTDWKWCVPYPPHFLGSALLITGRVGCFILRVRTINYQTYPRFASASDVYFRKVIDTVVADHRTGSVRTASATSVTIQPDYSGIYYSTDYFAGMTIEIIAGTGAGQRRTVSASSASYTPSLTVDRSWEVVPDTTSRYRITGNEVLVRGWDPVNDRNGDGYVDDAEFANLANPKATARMPWEARVTTGSGWSSSNGTCRSNLFNPEYVQALFELYTAEFASSGIRGYDNDDALVLLNYSATRTLYGGKILEYDAIAGHDDRLNEDYRDAFLAFHRKMRQEGGFEWIGTNISQNNMFISSFTRPYLNVFTSFRCEASIWDKDGQANNSGILRLWFLVAYAKAGVSPVIQCHPNYGSFLSNLGNTEQTWNLIKEGLLARYLLLNIPDKTFFNLSWRTFWYGSGLTSSTSTSTSYYWKSGVPKNYAYLPFKVLSVDIGEPANTIPRGYQPVNYYYSVPGGSAYYIVGRSTDQQVNVLDVGEIPIYPTYIFYLWASSNTVAGMPQDAVLARQYTKGLVLVRLPAISAPGGFLTYQASTITASLPGTYRRVNYDGTLGPPITEITLRGYEGAILVDANADSAPNVLISVSTDKERPKPLDVVTVTITATNNGAQEAKNVRVQHPIPAEATYVRGSLKLNGQALPDPSDTTRVDVTIPSIPAGGQAIVQFQMVIK